MKRIIIIGVGFAGIAALGELQRGAIPCEIILIDKKEQSHFLPLLPDIVGREMPARYLTLPFPQFCSKINVFFVQEEVVFISPDKREVVTNMSSYRYDYLIIASGTETDFYGNYDIARKAFKLDTVWDGEKILDLLRYNASEVCIVVGGGYTGIEIATHMKVFCNRYKIQKKIFIIERSSSIVGKVPDKMRNYIMKNLNRMGIAVYTSCNIEYVEGNDVYLSGGIVFHDPILVWTAGVRTPDFVQTLETEKTDQGRLIVDDYLRVSHHIFVAGDSAGVNDKGKPVRMAVQLSLAEGRHVARNIIRDIRGRSLYRYHPFDLGYMIPMANNRSCGIMLGVPVFGFCATVLHYVMCFYCSFSMKNKVGIIRSFLLSLFKKQKIKE